MKKINENGFTLIEGLLVVIALTLVGFTGFYVYNVNKKDDKPSSQQSQQPAKKEAKKEEKKDESLSWKEMVSVNKAFKMRVPDGWKINNNPEKDAFISSLDPNELKYIKGQPAVITNDKVLASDAPHRFTVGIYDLSSSYFIPGSTISEFALSSGLKGKKGVGSQQDLLNGTGTIKSIHYEFEKNGKLYIANYSMLEGDPDNSEVVEKAVKTLQL